MVSGLPVWGRLLRRPPQGKQSRFGGWGTVLSLMTSLGPPDQADLKVVHPRP